jgi:hypothetical protein
MCHFCFFSPFWGLVGLAEGIHAVDREELLSLRPSKSFRGYFMDQRIDIGIGYDAITVKAASIPIDEIHFRHWTGIHFRTSVGNELEGEWANLSWQLWHVVLPDVDIYSV